MLELMTPDFSHLIANLAVYPLQADATLWERVVQSRLIPVLFVLTFLAIVLNKTNAFAGIDKQRERVASEVETLSRQKEQALAQLEEVKRRTANLSGEVEEILRGAREQAETLSAQILNDAQAEAGKIVENSRKRVGIEQRAAMKALERRLLEEALGDARSELAQSLTADDQRRSVEAFLEELSQRGGAK